MPMRPLGAAERSHWVLRGDKVVEVIYYVAASLDGHIAPLDKGLSWLEPFESSAEDYGYGDFYRSIDAVLVGSQTFKQVAQFPQWPYPDKPCWVCSLTPLTVQLGHYLPAAGLCDRPASRGDSGRVGPSGVSAS